LSEESGVFSVSSSYKALEELVLLEGVLSVDEEVIFEKLWESPAPSKVVAFSWMALMDRMKVGKTQEGGVELCFQKRFFLTKNSTVLRIQSLMEFRL